MSLTVTVVDNETGETATEQVPDGDYMLITAPPCYLAHSHSYLSGTHQLTIKGRNRVAVAVSKSYPTPNPRSDSQSDS